MDYFWWVFLQKRYRNQSAEAVLGRLFLENAGDCREQRIISNFVSCFCFYVPRFLSPFVIPDETGEREREKNEFEHRLRNTIFFSRFDFDVRLESVVATEMFMIV
ncbi:hypothetical protein EUGRSUZ_F04193 [Eucalyptus grandis]|uniref:Uncharacterized protein n=2 Tax=Eucalyptus grandis TaxID=71139 RepID=A0ACC3KP25_EUCGR|nr:hypothetical protein EUGRSUZ_F04193 [Eucalyptus grandis]